MQSSGRLVDRVDQKRQAHTRNIHFSSGYLVNSNYPRQRDIYEVSQQLPLILTTLRNEQDVYLQSLGTHCRKHQMSYDS